MQNVQAFIEIYKKMTELLPERLRKRIPFMFALYFVTGVVETLGISSILPFIYAIIDTEALMAQPYVAKVLNAFNLTDSKQITTILGLAVILIFVLKNVFVFVARRVQTIYEIDAEQEISETIMNAYMKRPYQFFVESNPSKLYNDAVGNAGTLAGYINYYGAIASEIVTAALIGILIIVTDGMLAIGVLVVGIILILVISIGLKSVLRNAGAEGQRWGIKRTQTAYEIFGGIKEIYVTQTKDKFVNDYAKAGKRYKKSRKTATTLSLLPERIIEVGFAAGIIGVVLIKLYTTDDMTSFVPKLAVFALAAFRLLPSINKISSNINNIVYGRARLESASEVINGSREYLKSVEAEHYEGGELTFERSIEVRNVTFSYKNGQDSVIKNLNLEIKKGESVAFIGQSGAGKTTLSDIILGLFKPQEGSVYVDGKDIYGSLPEWAKIVAYVPQSVYLLDNSVRANVAFGYEEGEFSDDEIWAALEKAQLKGFVESLPKGLDTFVGDRGVRFSGGQRQRIAIARALLRNPEILILDEATSALDNETESAIMEAVDSLKSEKTMIIVAHRLTTIRNCDKIYEIGQGKATLRTHEEVFAE